MSSGVISLLSVNGILLKKKDQLIFLISCLGSQGGIFGHFRWHYHLTESVHYAGKGDIALSKQFTAAKHRQSSLHSVPGMACNKKRPGSDTWSQVNSSNISPTAKSVY